MDSILQSRVAALTVAFFLVSPVTLGDRVLAQKERVQVDPKLSVYKPLPGVTGGTIKTVGSETMSNMMSFWTQEFKKFYAGVETEVDAKGSGNAFPALIFGQANIGMMSRPPNRSEIADFKKRYGYVPLVLPTSVDMLAIWVHKENPIERMTFEELDAIYSSTRKLGAQERATSWRSFSGTGAFASKPIVCFGRNAVSGTYGFFKDKVLRKGDYGAWVNELGGSSSVTQSVGADMGAIGYSGIGFHNASVKAIKVSKTKDSKAYAPIPKHAYDGTYPLTRFLYIVLNRDPRASLDATTLEFLKFIYSQQGQKQVVKDGYIPLPADVAAKALSMIASPAR